MTGVTKKFEYGMGVCCRKQGRAITKSFPFCRTAHLSADRARDSAARARFGFSHICGEVHQLRRRRQRTRQNKPLRPDGQARNMKAGRVDTSKRLRTTPIAEGEKKQSGLWGLV